MKEDCATSMSARHGCTDNKAVIESFKEALIGRVGADRYRMWFAHGVSFDLERLPASDDASSCHVSLSTEGAASPENADLGNQNATGCESPQAIDRAAAHVIVLSIRGQFALDRLRQNFLREIRGAAMQACGVRMAVQLRLDEPLATQAELPLSGTAPVDASSTSQVDASSTSQAAAANAKSGVSTSVGPNQGPSSTADGATSSSKVGRRIPAVKRRRARPLASLIAEGAGSVGKLKGPSREQSRERITQQLEFPSLEPQAPRAGGDQNSAAVGDGEEQSTPVDAKRRKESVRRGSRFAMSSENFVAGTSNQLAYTAMSMFCQDPRTASPLFFCGPTGTGKTHLMTAIAEQLRRRHRMRRVMHLSAEQFTNDFISSVGNSGISAFRRRYREVDALLIDDVQFLGSKKATLREMLYTVETLASAGRPLIFSGLHSPNEIPGLSRELAGRMASGLVCPLQPLDSKMRQVIFSRWLEERCPLEVPEPMVEQVSGMLAGDGRVISGLVNMINTLQRMYGRMPSIDELRQHGGDLLRASAPVASLSVIETAVCDTFHLPQDTLRGGSQTRAVTGPRMLAMYLSRQLTSSAYVEIAQHFGGKSHSTAISAENNVKRWMDSGKMIGRGQGAMSVREAIDRVENLLRSG